MRIEDENPRIGNPIGRCFFRATPFLPGHKYYAQALLNPPPREVIEETWDDAVNDTANLWLSIFTRALGPEKSLRLYGIPAPKGEVGKGWFCW